MEILRPDSRREALEMKAAEPDARPIAGGADLMDELNFDRSRPQAILDLTRVPELTGWGPEDRRLRGPGAGAAACTGSAAPTPSRAGDAEAFIAGERDWWDRALAEFGRLVARAAQPIDDFRGTAAYRRHALAVLARRTLAWARQEAAACA